MKNNAPVLIFCRLHPLNLPIATICSLFMRVAYWRKEYLPTRWLKRFTVLDPAEHFDLDEWQSAISDAYLAFRQGLHISEHAMPERLAGICVDFRAHWLQWLAIRFEEFYLFTSLSQRWLKTQPASAKCHIAGSAIDELANGSSFQLSEPYGAKTVRILALADRLWLWATALVLAARQVASLSRSSRAVQGFRFLWTGISPVEAAREPNKLDFAFLVRRGMLDPQACLYLLSFIPDKDAQHFLSRTGVRWMTVDDYLRPRPHTRFELLADTLAVLLRNVFAMRDRRRAPIRLEFALRSLPWLTAMLHDKPIAYITSVSTCWPESPEVAAFNAIGIRTVNWSYGGNTFCYSTRDSTFEDKALLRSITSAGEVWLWNEEVASWLRGRTIDEPPRVRIIGAVMSGDASWLNKSPFQARADAGFNLGPHLKCIAVFDVPSVSKKMRLQIGHGPSMYPIEMLEAFFADLEEVLKRFPSASLMLKPKRALDDISRSYAENMEKFINPAGIYQQQGKVMVVDHDIDPYIPVACADICIGVPFTSPVLAGISSGRSGIFYDPLDRTKFFQPANFGRYLIHGRDQLLDRIGSELAGASIEMQRTHYDPAANFVEALETR